MQGIFQEQKRNEDSGGSKTTAVKIDERVLGQPVHTYLLIRYDTYLLIR